MVRAVAQGTAGQAGEGRVSVMGPSEVDAGHLVVAVALTYLLGFERDLRGAPNVLAGAITGIGFLDQ
jgi:hypothetical protein